MTRRVLSSVLAAVISLGCDGSAPPPPGSIADGDAAVRTPTPRRELTLDSSCEVRGPNGLCVISARDHYVGQGRTLDAVFPEVLVSVLDWRPGSIQLVVDGRGSETPYRWSSWMFTFAAPGDDENFSEGRYEHVGRWSSETEAGLRINGDGRGCISHEGSFVIRELVRDPHPPEHLVRVVINFEHYCGGSGPMFGQIRFDAEAWRLRPDSGVPADAGTP